MGGRGIKRKKPQPKKPKQPKTPQPKKPESVPTIPTKRKKTPKGGDIGGVGGGGVQPQQPKPKELEDQPKKEGKTVRVGGFYFKLEPDGTLRRVGRKDEVHHMTPEGVEISVGKKVFRVLPNGTVIEQLPKPKKEENKKPISVQVSEIVSRYGKGEHIPGLEKGEYADYPGVPSIYINPNAGVKERNEQLRKQGRNSIRLIEQAGGKMPTDAELGNLLRDIGMSETSIKQLIDTPSIHIYKFNDSDRTPFSEASVRKALRDDDIANGVKAHAYLIADSIKYLQDNVLRDAKGLVSGFKLTEGKFGVGGSMSRLDNSYGININRMGVEAFSERLAGTHNIDFSIPGVATHEIGHAVYNKMHKKYGYAFDDIIENLYYKVKREGLMPSEYASVNPSEFFAESFLGMVKYKYWGHESTMGDGKGQYSKDHIVYQALHHILENGGMLQSSNREPVKNAKDLIDFDGMKAFMQGLKNLKNN